MFNTQYSQEPRQEPSWKTEAPTSTYKFTNLYSFPKNYRRFYKQYKPKPNKGSFQSRPAQSQTMSYNSARSVSKPASRGMSNQAPWARRSFDSNAQPFYPQQLAKQDDGYITVTYSSSKDNIDTMQTSPHSYDQINLPGYTAGGDYRAFYN